MVMMTGLLTGSELTKNVTGGSKVKMGFITGGLASVGALIKSVEHIPDGELAVKARGGSIKRKYDSYAYTKRAGDFHGYRGKGLAFSWPFLERFVRVNIQENLDKLEPTILTSRENRLMQISSAVTWNVIGEGENPYKALLVLNDPFNKNNFSELRQRVMTTSAEGLSVVMDGMPEKQMRNFREISGNVQDHTRDELLDYGVNMVKMQFKAPYPLPVERQREATLDLADAVRETGRSQALSMLVLSTLMQQNNAAGSEVYPNDDDGFSLGVA